MKKFGFGKSGRVVKNSGFRAVLSARKAASDKLLIIYMAPNERDVPRLGISISKSMAGAVLRNRIKRLLRETFRINRHVIPQGFDYVVMLSPYLSKSISKEKACAILKKLTFDEVCGSFVLLAEQIGQSGRLDVK
jgi:ribonuclease P protein component